MESLKLCAVAQAQHCVHSMISHAPGTCMEAYALPELQEVDRTRSSGSSEAVLCVLSQPLRVSSGRRRRPVVRLAPRLEKLEPPIDGGPRRLRDGEGDCTQTQRHTLSPPCPLDTISHPSQPVPRLQDVGVTLRTQARAGSSCVRLCSIQRGPRATLHALNPRPHTGFRHHVCSQQRPAVATQAAHDPVPGAGKATTLRLGHPRWDSFFQHTGPNGLELQLGLHMLGQCQEVL